MEKGGWRVWGVGWGGVAGAISCFHLGHLSPAPLLCHRLPTPEWLWEGSLCPLCGGGSSIREVTQLAQGRTAVTEAAWTHTARPWGAGQAPCPQSCAACRLQPPLTTFAVSKNRKPIINAESVSD